MLIPSIDLMGGQAVQLIGGKEHALDAGDPRPLATSFGRIGEVAVIDLDAALGQGDNRALIEDLLSRARCRVGGGIRSVEQAIRWLDLGAGCVILGTAARPDLLRKLPRERVMAALDAVHGEVVVDGWTKKTGATIEDRIAELRAHVGSFLITFIEREGRMKGTDMGRVETILRAAGDVPVTFAGGITTVDEIAAIDRLGADTQVGMALYTGAIGLAEAFAAPLGSDRPDGLWPTIVVDQGGIALGLAWSDAESLTEALRLGTGVYHSRQRGLWRKGESSGAVQELLRVDLDCDRDTLRFQVRQAGSGFCHRGTWSCFGEDAGLSGLSRRMAARKESAPLGSYTRRLFEDRSLLDSKLCEEAAELAQARSPDEVRHEVADVFYFTMVAMARGGVTLAEVEAELDARSRRITRRPGDAKPDTGAANGAQERQS